MKTATQPRRALSFREGLQEIKKALASNPERQDEGQATHAAAEAPRQPRPADTKKPNAQNARPGGPQGRAGQPGKPPHPRRGGPKPDSAAKGPRGPNPNPGPGSRGQKPKDRGAPRRPADPVLAARIERDRQLRAVRKRFGEQHPAFRDWLPLKIGVLDDLCTQHPELDKALISLVLKLHVNHPRYHEHVAVGGPRYELDGTASPGPGVEASHVTRATRALERQKQRQGQNHGPAQQAAAKEEPDEPATAEQPAAQQPPSEAEQPAAAPSTAAQ